MDLLHAKSINLQEALSSLSLQPRGVDERGPNEFVLVGKVLATRRFRRLLLLDIINKAWKLKGKVRVENVGENIFKFCFADRADKEFIFKQRPWSFNGSLLILKEWPEHLALQEICFDTTTFWVQVHGLPPAFLHMEAARQIGNLVGIVDESLISHKLVVAQRFLRIRVDIPVQNPLPAGFFQKRENGREIWIQFKLERLPDFCFTCGLIDHVTGRCNFSIPAMITTGAGLQAKLYGPWLRAENSGTTLFVNPPEKQEHRRPAVEILEILDTCDGTESNMCSPNASLLPYTDKEDQSREPDGKDDSRDRFQTALQTCPELQSLDFTLQRLPSGSNLDLQAAVLDKLRRLSMTTQDLASWASGILQVIATSREYQREEIFLTDPDFLGWQGLGQTEVRKALEGKDGPEGSKSISKKRMAQNFCEGSARGNRLYLEDAQREEISRSEEAHALGLSSLKITEVTEVTQPSPSVGEGITQSKVFSVDALHDGSPILFQPGRTEGEGISGSRKRYSTRPSNRNWTWKKAARAKAGISDNSGDIEGESSRGGARRNASSSKDFH